MRRLHSVAHAAAPAIGTFTYTTCNSLFVKVTMRDEARGAAMPGAGQFMGVLGGGEACTQFAAGHVSNIFTRSGECLQVVLVVDPRWRFMRCRNLCRSTPWCQSGAKEESRAM
jgi:hypothetical protein